MKAAKWNFVTFQGEKLTATMMEFITPPSYGSGKVNVSSVLKDNALLTAGTIGTVEYPQSKLDAETEWDEPTAVKAVWRGKTEDGKDVEGLIETTFANRLDRVDIMAEVPAIVKKFVAGAVGTRPYIYQVSSVNFVGLKVANRVVI